MNAPTPTTVAERIAPTPFRLSTEGPSLAPLDGAQVLVNVVINLEHWTLDRPMPRAALPAPGGLTVVPDVANHSWVLYGLRAGLPRLAAALEPLGSAVTIALNADVIDHYPAITDLIEERGWEVVAHGVRQQSIQSYPDGAEADVIAETVRRITDRFGAPRGWLSPGMNQTDDSLRLMREAGLEFNHDWMIDDRPTWLSTEAGPILGLPYTLTLNDVTTYQVGLGADGALADRARRTLARHVAEATAPGGRPAVMPIGLHPHIMGVPHRIAEIEQIVAAVQATPEAAFVTSTQLFEWYAGQVSAASELPDLPGAPHNPGFDASESGIRPDQTRDSAGVLAVIAEREPEVRAFTYRVPEAEVLAATSSGPLAGMAVAVKEIIDVGGMPVTYGSPLFADRVAESDAEAVARLKAAGAVVVGMVTTTPFACGTTTTTRNPHALDHTPGGSSAGSGAAVGAGMVPLALGSQSQASTLRPASYCGAWGFKPSHRALPREGMHLLAESLDDLGLFADTLDTLEAAVEVIGELTPVPTPARVRIGRLRLDDGGLPAPATEAALDALVARLASSPDVTVVEHTAELDAMDAALQGSGQSCFDIFAAESAEVLAGYVAAGEPDPRLAEMVDHATALGIEGLARALAHRQELRDQWAALADHVDVVITHAVVNPAPVGHASTGDRRMPATSSLLGVPALSAPWMTVGGLPHGAQLLGFEGRDTDLLAVARRLATVEEETR